jgi:hypothetical protein
MNRSGKFLWLDWIFQTVLLIILALVAADAPLGIASYVLMLLSWQVIRTFVSAGFLVYYLLILPSRSHRGKFLPHTSF